MFHYDSSALTRPRDVYLAPSSGWCGDCEGSLQPRRWVSRLRGISAGREPWNLFRFSLI
jgi:hypothetical protein